jgi:hypothetical protein
MMNTCYETSSHGYLIGKCHDINSYGNYFVLLMPGSKFSLQAGRTAGGRLLAAYAATIRGMPQISRV